MTDVSRRTVLRGAGLLSLAVLLPAQLLRRARAQSNAEPFRVFEAHQAEVVREATARLIPGPDDDPLETGHPGAREANVVRYIDLMLGALASVPEHVHAGGPWSNRKGGDANHMATFLPLSAAQRLGWERRLAALRAAYVEGIAMLDAAGFLEASPFEKDSILAQDTTGFRDLLFTHAIEGTYCIPEYGGNENLTGWQEIKFPGDSQPRGYTAEEVSQSDGPDPYVPLGVAAALMSQLELAARAYVRSRPGGR